jgi:hypothetical protein
LTKEDPGGEAPSAATPAQAAQELRSAWESEVTRAQELANALANERAQAKKLAPLHKSAAVRNQALVKLFATYPSRVTDDHYVQLGGELRRERELAQALDRAKVHIQELALAQAESQARAQALERALARTMAQARSLARERAQARSHGLRAIAVAGSFGGCSKLDRFSGLGSLGTCSWGCGSSGRWCGCSRRQIVTGGGMSPTTSWRS